MNQAGTEGVCSDLEDLLMADRAGNIFKKTLGLEQAGQEVSALQIHWKEVEWIAERATTVLSK